MRFIYIVIHIDYQFSDRKCAWNLMIKYSVYLVRIS